MNVFATAAFIYEEKFSYCVDSQNRVWTVLEMFDEEQDETDDPNEAVVARVVWRGNYGIANIDAMEHPVLN